MAKRKQQPPEEGSPAWMATFSDLMNLLLCFFVLLFASSKMDEGKIQEIAASFNNTTFKLIDTSTVSLVSGQMMSAGVTQLPDIQGILTEAGKNVHGPDGESEYATATELSNVSDMEVKEEFDKRGQQQSEEMYDEISELAESYIIDDSIIIDYTKQYVELELNGALLFEPERAEIKEESKMFLQKIASILVKYKHCIIEIEGHTDNVPLSGSRYTNNRELSAERARNVYEYISSQEFFIDANMKIAGYGESRPVASNSTAEGRARNRRVVIKIYNMQYSAY